MGKVSYLLTLIKEIHRTEAKCLDVKLQWKLLFPLSFGETLSIVNSVACQMVVKG